MAEQELKKLKRSEILELMLKQADEVEALRRETKEKEAEYKAKIEAQNDTIARLRAGLANAADEDSEESRQMDLVYKQIEQRMKDYRARIKELEEEVRQLKRGRIAAITEAESVEDATIQLNYLLEDARNASEQYLNRVKPKNGDEE